MNNLAKFEGLSVLGAWTQMHALFFFHSLAVWQRQKRLKLPMCGTTSRSRRELFSPLPYIERAFLSADKLIFPMMLKRGHYAKNLRVQRRPPCSKRRGSCYDPAFHCGLMLTSVFGKAIRLRCSWYYRHSGHQIGGSFPFFFSGIHGIYKGRDILATAAGRYNVLGARHKNPCSHKRYCVAHVVPEVQQGFHWISFSGTFVGPQSFNHSRHTFQPDLVTRVFHSTIGSTKFRGGVGFSCVEWIGSKKNALQRCDGGRCKIWSWSFGTSTGAP